MALNVRSIKNVNPMKSRYKFMNKRILVKVVNIKRIRKKRRTFHRVIKKDPKLKLNLTLKM